MIPAMPHISDMSPLFDSDCRLPLLSRCRQSRQDDLVQQGRGQFFGATAVQMRLLAEIIRSEIDTQVVHRDPGYARFAADRFDGFDLLKWH